jgi:hypothetical protein
MQPGSPEHVNLRLDSAQWISTDADRVYFAKLVAEISGWERPGEKLNIAPIEEPFAWRRNYALLGALKRRGPDRQATEAAEEISRAEVAHSRLLNEFAADRQALLDFRARNRLQWGDLSEYVGVSDDDLVEGVRDAHFGDEVGWQESARRVGGALSRLQGMSVAERSEVPRIVAQRRRLAVLKAHDTDINTLRDALNQVLQRLEALETRLPSQVELREAADAAA